MKPGLMMKLRIMSFYNPTLNIHLHHTVARDAERVLQGQMVSYTALMEGSLCFITTGYI